MTETPAVLQVTFDGVRGEQLYRRWVAEVGGLEAYVFDGDDLATPAHWQSLLENVRVAAELGAARLTMHFPTENADWVNDAAAFDKLRRFCDLAADHPVAGIVLHANQFVDVDDWPAFDLGTARKSVVGRLAELDEYLAGAPIWIGMENMPIIGAAGIDFDSVFVRPDDFLPLLELESERIGVTWDVCHWAVTYSTLRAIDHLEQRQPRTAALALPALPIKHVHFASFAGHAMPYWPDGCLEGVPPQRGDLDQDLLARMLATAIDGADGEVGVVFEVQEEDYLRRTNCWETLSWLASRPELAGRYSIGGSDDRQLRG